MNEQEYLTGCAEHFDITDQPRREFLLKWGHALEAYGTPASFSLGTEFTTTTLNIDGKEYGRIFVIATNNARRGELMKEQKKHPYILHEPATADTYTGLDLADCFLCENVAQAFDAAHDDAVADNLVAIIEGDSLLVDETHELYILPNRYPAMPGHGLTIPVVHDDMSNRRQHDNKNPKTYHEEPGKTRGAILTKELLYLTIKAGHDYRLVAMRNHVLDGMSIPGHDHFHTFPEELPWVAIADKVIETKEPAKRGGALLGSGIYTLGNTPWDTLALTFGSGEELTERSLPILEKMEKDNIVFTLFLRDDTLLVSPRRETNTYQQIGAGIPIHYFDKTDFALLPLALQKVFKKGEFPWEKYV